MQIKRFSLMVGVKLCSKPLDDGRKTLKPTNFMINGEKIVLKVCSMKMLQQKSKRRRKQGKLFGHKSDDITTKEAIICRIQYQELKAGFKCAAEVIPLHSDVSKLLKDMAFQRANGDMGSSGHATRRKEEEIH
uniref:Uncharacterized protein n=1 Tax=Glossina austeni TaxID=7395 RepID=A0A1A9V1X1_GLOAU